MKKIIFLFILLLIITGCNNDVVNDTNSGKDVRNINEEINEIDGSFNDDLSEIEEDIDSI